MQITFAGDGPLGQMILISDHRGQVKALLQHPHTHVPLRANGQLNVAAAIGNGVLSVVRSHPLMREPYTGTIPIYNGEVAEDLAHYLADSEQVGSGAGVALRTSHTTWQTGSRWAEGPG